VPRYCSSTATITLPSFLCLVILPSRVTREFEREIEAKPSIKA
jgi:hypothetical protein